MKSAVIVFPGTNRERDMAQALYRVSGQRPEMVWHRDRELPQGLDFIVLPGGFSYGDYLRCGAMAANSPIVSEVIAAAKKGVRILGVCNGFQILAETQLVPGTLMRNASLKFICKRVNLEIQSNDNEFLNLYKAGDEVEFPVAHGEGNYFADADTLKRIKENDQVALRYVDSINGSQDNIAGVFNAEKTILGMMPHPEDAVDPLHGGTDGLKLFQGILGSLS